MIRVRAGASAVLAVALPVITFAQVVRHVPTIRKGTPILRSSAQAQQPKFQPLQIGSHTFYGTITEISGDTIVVRTRHQVSKTVDARAVLAAGTYSAPLFVGKLVSVDGSLAANGVYTAAHIYRMTNLNALPNDH